MNEQDDDKELGELLRAHATRYTASPALQASIRAEIALLGASTGPRPTVPPPRPRRVWAWPWHQGWLAGASFAGGAFAAVMLTMVLGVLGPLGGIGGAGGSLDDQLVSGHVRSLMVQHLSDVVSTDQHTVKPWFQGKLDYSPPVEDFAPEGFPLIGGRLDYIGQRPVAALVYRRNGHIINCYVWPSGDAAATSPERLTTQQGFHLVRWREAGMQFALVSDLNARELESLGRLWREPPSASAPR